MLKQLTKLLSGSALGQLIAFLFIPILTHLFEPDVFGEYQVAFSMALFLAILFSWKLEIALPTLNSDQIYGHMKSVAKLIIINAIILSGILTLIITQTTLLSIQTSAPIFITFTILIAVCMAFNSLFRFYLIEKQKFGTISLVLFCQSGGRSAAQWLMQLLPKMGLLIGDLLARTTMLLIAISVFVKQDKVKTDSSVKQTIASQWRYPVWVMPSTLLNSSMAILLIPLIAYKFGAFEAGVVAVAYRLITAPNSLIGAAIADVLFARFTGFAKKMQFKTLRAEFVKASMLLVLLSLSGFGLLYLLADYLTLLLAANYQSAPLYLITLIPWFAAQFMVAPLSRVIFIYNKQALKFIIDLMIFANLLLLIFLFDGVDILSFLQSVSLNMALIYLAYLALVYFIVLTGKEQEVKHV